MVFVTRGKFTGQEYCSPGSVRKLLSAHLQKLFDDADKVPPIAAAGVYRVEVANRGASGILFCDSNAD